MAGPAGFTIRSERSLLSGADDALARRDFSLQTSRPTWNAPHWAVILFLVGLVVLPRVIASFLYGITAHDLAALFGAGALLVCVAFGACYLPARRATKIDPLSALHYE